MSVKQLLLLLSLWGYFIHGAEACTIFSGKDKKGQTWAGNNEDNLFSFDVCMNTTAATDTTFGFVFFTNSANPDEYIQGGVNEAGLFYDGNAVPPSVYSDYDKKLDFPGGHRAMIRYMLGTCKTVQEVMQLFTKYRLPGTESGQLHFADSFGNLGIIVSDSMWISKTDYQVSTNYNLCHPGHDGVTCWRYPIAERMLQANEPGQESFRAICDSTSQKELGCTIYSNIHNLNTGDLWLYYAGDYERPFKTNLNTLLKKGNSTYPLYTLFESTPVVSVYTTYLEKGIAEGMKILNAFSLTGQRKNEIGRILFSGIIVRKHDFSSQPFLATLMLPGQRTDELVEVMSGLALFCTGKKEDAMELLRNYTSTFPEGKMVELANIYLNQFQGIFDPEANVSFELKGYETAKYVFVDGLEEPNFTCFLVRQNGKWVGSFHLEPGEYSYTFFVDGKRITDPGNPDVVKSDGISCSRLVIKK